MWPLQCRQRAGRYYTGLALFGAVATDAVGTLPTHLFSSRPTYIAAEAAASTAHLSASAQAGRSRPVAQHTNVSRLTRCYGDGVITLIVPPEHRDIALALHAEYRDEASRRDLLTCRPALPRAGRHLFVAGLDAIRRDGCS